jgi:hypothetical protein
MTPTKNALARRAVLGDGAQRAAVRLAGQLYVERAGVQPEQGQQQRGVVDVGAVGGVLIARSGMHADPLALLGQRAEVTSACAGP